MSNACSCEYEMVSTDFGPDRNLDLDIDSSEGHPAGNRLETAHLYILEDLLPYPI